MLGYRRDVGSRARGFPQFARVLEETLWCHSQAVRQWSAKPPFPGSNPGGTSKKSGCRRRRASREGRRPDRPVMAPLMDRYATCEASWVVAICSLATVFDLCPSSRTTCELRGPSCKRSGAIRRALVALRSRRIRLSIATGFGSRGSTTRTPAYRRRRLENRRGRCSCAYGPIVSPRTRGRPATHRRRHGDNIAGHQSPSSSSSTLAWFANVTRASRGA